MTIIHKLIGAGGLFLLIIITGIIISRLGKPYNTALFTVHKLLALAFVILTVFIVRSLLTNIDVNNLIVALLVLAAVSCIGLFVTGGLLSARDSGYKVMVTVHSVLPILAGISSVAAIILLLGRK